MEDVFMQNMCFHKMFQYLIQVEKTVLTESSKLQVNEDNQKKNNQ